MCWSFDKKLRDFSQTFDMAIRLSACCGGCSLDVYIQHKSRHNLMVIGQLGYDWKHVLNDGEAMGFVVVFSAWGHISYNFLSFFVALQSVPKSLIEAGSINGAHFWRRFFDIVLPLITLTAFFLLVVNVGYAFFEIFGVITQSLREGRSKQLLF